MAKASAARVARRQGRDVPSETIAASELETKKAAAKAAQAKESAKPLFERTNVAQATQAGFNELKAGTTTGAVKRVRAYVAALTSQQMTMEDVESCLVREHEMYREWRKEKGLPLIEYGKGKTAAKPYTAVELSQARSVFAMYRYKAIIGDVLASLEKMHASLSQIKVISYWLKEKVGGKPRFDYKATTPPSLNQLATVLAENRKARKRRRKLTPEQEAAKRLNLKVGDIVGDVIADLQEVATLTREVKGNDSELKAALAALAKFAKAVPGLQKLIDAVKEKNKEE